MLKKFIVLVMVNVFMLITIVSALAIQAPPGSVPAPLFEIPENKYNFGVNMGYVGISNFGKRARDGYRYAIGEHWKQEFLEACAFMKPDKQVEIFGTFIKAKVDAIFANPVDTVALVEPALEAWKAGIPCFTADSYIFDAHIVSSVFSDNFTIGAAAADFFHEMLPEGGNVVVLHVVSNEMWGIRDDGFRYGLRKYPNIKIIFDKAVDNVMGETFQSAMENALSAYPERGSINGVYTIADSCAADAWQPIVAAGRQEEMFVTGCDGDNFMIDLIRASDGKTGCIMTFGQSPFEMAFHVVENAIKHLEGIRVPRIIISPTWLLTKDNLPDPKVKEISISEDSYGYDEPWYVPMYGELRNRI